MEKARSMQLATVIHDSKYYRSICLTHLLCNVTAVERMFMSQSRSCIWTFGLIFTQLKDETSHDLIAYKRKVSCWSTRHCSTTYNRFWYGSLHSWWSRLRVWPSTSLNNHQSWAYLAWWSLWSSSHLWVSTSSAQLLIIEISIS